MAGLLFLTACENVQLQPDALSRNLPPQQAQACRDATWQALSEVNITEDWARRVVYTRVRSITRTGGNPLRGFEAWVYPKEGRGSVVVELSVDCQVRSIRFQGIQRDYR